MRQQINLFQAVLIDKPEPLQAAQLKLILLLFLALLGLLSLFGWWQLNSAAGELAGLQQQQQGLEKKVQLLEEKYPERRKSSLLEEELRRSEQRLAGQKQLLGYFSDRSEQGNQIYLETLSGLAQYRTKGVWLRRIQLSASGQAVALDGSALKPDQVPQYLQLLGKENVLGGKVFSRLALTRLNEQAGSVDFSLESLTEEQQ
ncbi:Fimbrial assembly protein (PilN) [Malonomonas rubra DSM 5091]|uniref:Fimbrial assembly protein (PilN) n=1 Tax=Malonomonas rubra DSM 5091 TaxID=1122189 RepID=A0A1M6M5G0_MALRU|nr:PilN domain-containing protein [Malonomonas rubra]SHJ78716.1 Fimbrial assembly protein (PilN) [Malonomonas rubra DSM 5091]